MSPGTSASIGTSSFLTTRTRFGASSSSSPSRGSSTSRRTVAVLLTMRRSCSTARLERASWKCATNTAITTIANMMIAPILSLVSSPLTQVITASTVNRMLIGLVMKRSSSCSRTGLGFSCATTFAPKRSRRSSTCSGFRPSGIRIEAREHVGRIEHARARRARPPRAPPPRCAHDRGRRHRRSAWRG